MPDIKIHNTINNILYYSSFSVRLVFKELCVYYFFFFSTNPERYFQFVNEETKVEREISNVP